MTRRLSILPSTLARAVRLVWLSDRRLAFWHTALIVLQALLPLGTLVALKQVIDRATRQFTDAAPIPFTWGGVIDRLSTDTDFRSLVLWIAAGAFCLVLSAAARLLISWVAEFHAIAVTDRIYDLLHHALLRADYAFFENPDDQNRLYMAREEALDRPTRLLAGLGQLLHSVIGISGVFVILASFTFWLPLLLCLSALPVLLFKLDRTRRFYEWRKSLTPLDRQAAYFHAVMTDNAGAKEIRLYGHGDFCRRRFAAARARLREARVAWRRFVLTREAMGIFVGLAVTGMILLWMTSRLLAGAVTVGALVLCVQSVQRGQQAVTALLNAISALFEDALFLQSFEALLQQPRRICAPEHPMPVPPAIRQGITFENVSFTYPGCAEPALRNLTFTLRPGERVALAGPNGAGKSTLVKLLCRLYDPDSGRIWVDGTDLRAFDPDAWRRCIGALFQDFNHYQFTLRDNIRIGHPATPEDSPEIERAACDAGLGPLLKSWPQGLDTRLGRWLHDGIEPSIGQWQKIALARAFLRPALLTILDEPTSALDDAAQRETFEALARLSHGRIALFTSHRQLTPGMADRLLVLRDGELVSDCPLPDGRHSKTPNS
ncbi:MAG TPA: ABC transporter ATP-binding protein [Kiritimatiellia bacterium]|nr:ABC transporter ATP-binding protein [Kiritimatiellia bacterium]HRU70973.1 ABC transporter ATP-binding protein [Kiritimatiellia bacterium]